MLLKVRLKLKAPMSKHFGWAKENSFNEMSLSTLLNFFC